MVTDIFIQHRFLNNGLYASQILYVRVNTLRNICDRVTIAVSQSFDAFKQDTCFDASILFEN